MWQELGLAAATTIAAVPATAVLIYILRPLLLRYALARPNARSLHKVPTPQCGGIAVVAATIATAFAAAAIATLPALQWTALAIIAVAAVCLAVLGAVDDIRPLPALPRLLLHLVLAGVTIAALPVDLRLFTPVPWLLERAVLVVGLAWFVNLTNFMDGMDWMTVAEAVPVGAALAAFAAIGVLPAHMLFLALALVGALLGFAPFNAPVARLFLGDVGSLPIGLLLGYGLIELALAGDFAAAVLLPLYYIADSGLTLARRWARGAKLSEAHREHFYQLAAARGLSSSACIARVFLTNLVLIALAFVSHFVAGSGLPALALGTLAVGLLLVSFARA